jgi:DNA-3-methyladenine glycosylase
MNLTKEFFAQETIKVAKELLGKVISYNGYEVRITETEAYKDDKASHAYKKTERSKLMYETYGHVYVYLIYGMYYCLNFTTDQNKPGAVLIRSALPLKNQEKMTKNRKGNKDLTSGPGKLCQALGITKKENGLEIGKKFKIYDDGFKIKKINKSSRIGIKEDLHLMWRFHI